MSSPSPIRSKILKILVIPLVSLVALWGFVAYSTVSQVVGISQTQSQWQQIGVPTRQLIIEFQRERQLTAQAVGRTKRDKPLGDQRKITNGRAKQLREAVASVNVEIESGDAPANVRALLTAMDGLEELRAAADSGKITSLQVTDTYNAFISVANRQFSDSEGLTDVSSFRVVRGMSAYGTTAEYLGREHAVLTAALKRGNMTQAEHAAFVVAMTSRRVFLTNAERDMGPDLRSHHQELAGSAAYRRLQTAEDRLFVWDVTGALPMDAAVWKQDTETVLGAVNQYTQQELLRATVRGEEIKSEAFLRIGLVLGLGLLAVIVSIVASYRFGRSMITELKRLQTLAVELAEERLPRLFERLRKGDDVDPAAEVSEQTSADTAEIDRVVHAFSAVWRTAVEAAVGQATLRKGIGQVFLNLAWRNQALLHRQLTLLDTMERRVEDPEILEDLFKLDHLTTRMRRHAENLIILSDAVPARRWRDPVSTFDVVRSSVLEIEDYTRVTLLPMPQAPLLVGNVVTDVIHLIAELVENATAFSPPNTVVHIRGTTAANGFALEIEDRGLGLTQDTLDELNAKLADPPEFDLADSDRLGLFVVARLAARHKIKVVLRPSPYDGTTAIVLLPPGLLAVPETPLIGTQIIEHGQPHPGGQTGVARTGGAVRALSAAPEAWSRPASIVPAQPVVRVEESSSWFPPPRWQEQDPPQASPRQAFPGPDADDDLDGLPVRVRQSSLAPQLRQRRSREQRDVSNRSPEEIFDLMSSMQQGWQQGRGPAEQDQDVWNGKEGHSDGRPQI